MYVHSFRSPAEVVGHERRLVWFAEKPAGPRKAPDGLGESNLNRTDVRGKAGERMSLAGEAMQKYVAEINGDMAVLRRDWGTLTPAAKRARMLGFNRTMLQRRTDGRHPGYPLAYALEQNGEVTLRITGNEAASSVRKPATVPKRPVEAPAVRRTPAKAPIAPTRLDQEPGRVERLQRPNTEVYVQLPNGAVEKGTVYRTETGFVVRNAIAGWEVALDPAKAWTTRELEEANGIDAKYLKDLPDAARFVHNANDMMRKNCTMSPAKVREYFGEFNQGVTTMKQRSGTCYAIAGFEALRSCTFGLHLIAVSCRLVPDENRPTHMDIRLPLGDPSGRVMRVNLAAASAPKTESPVPLRLSRDPRSGEVTGVEYRKPASLSVSTEPPDAPLGWQALLDAVSQRWYSNSRLMQEGQDTSTQLTRLVHGATRDNVYILKTSTSADSEARLAQHSGFQKQATEFLRNYSNGRQIATALTPDLPSTARLRPGESQHDHTYTVGPHTLYYNHVYSILAVRKDRSGAVLSIRVSESNKPGKYLDLTQDQFMQAFNGISAVRVDCKTLFRPRS